MHQNDRTVCQIPIHNCIIIRCCIHKFPVFCIQRPHKEWFLYCIINILVGSTIRCSGHCGNLTTCLLQCIVCFLEFCLDIINGHIGKCLAWMIPGMVTDLTSQIYHTLNSGFPVYYILTQHKECCMGIILFQTIQKFICVFSRSVIKSKGDPWLVLRRIISSIIIKIIIVKSPGDPSCLNISVVIKRVCITVYFLHT